MSRSIFFVHTGAHDVARYAVLHAVSLGLDVHVIGDEAWGELPSIKWHPITNYADASAEFRSVYHHLSVNDPNYERFCFERWFMIAEAARRMGLQQFYYADSDLLVFPKAFDENFERRFTMFDTAWYNYFQSIPVLVEFCEYLICLYREGDALQLAEKHSVDGQKHLSDMHCLFEYGSINSMTVAPLSSLGPFLGFDERFSKTDIAKTSDFGSSTKGIFRESGTLKMQLKGTEEKLELRTLHFQGRSKPFIQAFHNIRNPIYNKYLDDLSGWYAHNNLLTDPECLSMSRALADELNKSADQRKFVGNSYSDGPEYVKTEAFPSIRYVSHIPTAIASGEKLMQNKPAFEILSDLISKVTINNRDHILKIINIYGFQGAATEVGTFNGTFAADLLENTKIEKLNCVDPYIVYDEFRDAINDMDMELIFAQAQRFLRRFEPRVEFIRDFSVEASKKIADGSLDFVYIDGNHQAEFVAKDLQAWWPKIRKGGLIIGDDCADTDDSLRNDRGDVTLVHRRREDGTPELYGDYGVLFALRNFAAEHDLGYLVMGSQFVLPK